MDFNKSDDSPPQKKPATTLNGDKIIYELINDLFSYENHYNVLQNKYKGLATTWVVATFMGIGYLLSGYEVGISFNLYLSVMFICLISSIGIFLLWHLDAGLYHKFLESIFFEVLKMEKEYPLIGKSHHNIMKLHYLEHDPHILHGMFYSSFIVFLITISAACLGIYLYEYNVWYFAIVISLILIGWIIFIKMHKKALLINHGNNHNQFDE